MGKLTNLLRYKKKVQLINPYTSKPLETVWVRLIGEEDLQESFKAARLVSASKRELLRDKKSPEYLDAISQLKTQTKETLEELVLAAAENKFSNESAAIVVREDLPEIDTIASIPDAPTLEEQERLDKEVLTINDRYAKSIEEYIQTKMAEIRGEISGYSEKHLSEKAFEALSQIQPMQDFVNEMAAQKAFRGTFMDELCKVNGFDNVEEFKNSDAHIKEQITTAYNSLEMGSEDLKN